MVCFLLKKGGESGGPLLLDTGVWLEESSEPATSSCGEEAVGVVDGDMPPTPTPPTPVKLRNMASIESAELALVGPRESRWGRFTSSTVKISCQWEFHKKNYNKSTEFDWVNCVKYLYFNSRWPLQFVQTRQMILTYCQVQRSSSNLIILQT